MKALQQGASLGLRCGKLLLLLVLLVLLVMSMMKAVMPAAAQKGSWMRS
jgi:hypothetical protein